MPLPPLDSPHTPNFDKDKGKSPLGNSSTPPEPLFETDNDVVPDDGRPADGSDKDDSGKK
jgi:hypothetical protein